MQFEFLIPERPRSVRAKNKKRYNEWKLRVSKVAAQAWNQEMLTEGDLHLTLVYLYEQNPADADNIIKAIQDALRNLVYLDDSLITDVESHRRCLSENFELTQLPSILISGIQCGSECVYVKVCTARQLEEYL